ncbi:MAG: S41 family peptidase, partial [Alkaliphilus sp.]
PQHALDRIKANRVFHEVNKEEIMSRLDEFLYPFESNEGEIPVSELNFVAGVPRETITIEEAKQDVAHFFRLLKFGYAGYQYFGGDETFLKAKKDVIKYLEEKHESEMSTADLEILLFNNLQFVQDGHFTVGSQRLMRRHNLLMSERREFLKDKSGYYTIIEEIKYLVSTINGRDPKEYFRLSINESGEIVYFIGIICDEGKSIREAIVELTNRKEIIQERFILIEPQQFIARGKEAYALCKIDEIPILKIRNMTPQGETDRSLNEFVEDAKKLRDEEVIIVDIRENGGGNSYFPTRWVNNIAGYDVNPSFVAINLLSNQTAKMAERILFSHGEINEVLKGRIRDLFNMNTHPEARWPAPEWSIQLGNNDLKVDNEAFIIVLMDSGTMSSAEGLVESLKRFKRVIFVGTNSGGVDSIGNVGSYALPNSRIGVAFGFTIFTDLTRKNREGLGFKPDFWVSPHEALERVVEMIRKYDIINAM